MSTKTGTPPRATTAFAVEDERERGHDDLVAGLDAREDRRHLERSRARVGEQGTLDADGALEPRAASPRERAVAAQLRSLDGGLDVLQLTAGRERAVEGNVLVHRLRHCRHRRSAGPHSAYRMSALLLLRVSSCSAYRGANVASFRITRTGAGNRVFHGTVREPEATVRARASSGFRSPSTWRPDGSRSEGGRSRPGTSGRRCA